MSALSQLIAKLPKAARLKRSIFVAFILSILSVICLMIFLMHKPPEKIRDTLDDDKDNAEWLITNGTHPQIINNEEPDEKSSDQAKKLQEALDQIKKEEANKIDEKENPEKIATTSAIQVSTQSHAAQVSKVISAGTLIPLVLITELNSELPGYVQAQVIQNIYDMKASKTILVPQGTKVLLQYETVHFSRKELRLNPYPCF